MVEQKNKCAGKKKEKIVVELENPKYNHWYATCGGPCWAAQGAIDKACAKAGDIYVYYRRENRGDTVFAVYSAEGVPPIENSESIQKFPRIAEYPTFRDAKKSPYGPAFEALWKFVKEQIALRK